MKRKERERLNRLRGSVVEKKVRRWYLFEWLFVLMVGWTVFEEVRMSFEVEKEKKEEALNKKYVTETIRFFYEMER